MSLKKKIETALSLSREDFLRVIREKLTYLIAKTPGITVLQKRQNQRILAEMIANPGWQRVPKEHYQTYTPFLSFEELNEIKQTVSQEEKDRLIVYADAICEHTFDLLGSGPVNLGAEINWQQDFISGRVWPYVLQQDSFIIDLQDDSDIKVPWELSRHQFFTALGQAYLYTGNEKYVAQFKELVEHWIATNAYRVGVNWLCSMDIGFRAISWLWGRTFFENSASLDEEFWTKFHGVLASHGEYIFNNIEDWGGIKNNHFMSNGTALYLLGLALPNIDGASAWHSKGKEILEECMEKQVLDDGVDYEMSTAYHRLVVELLLTPFLFARRANDSFSEQYVRKLEKMFEFVAGYTKPDGDIALFGDNDNGRCQILSEYTRSHINDHRYLLCAGAVLFERSDFAGSAKQFFDEVLWLAGPKSNHEFERLNVPTSTSTKAFEAGGFYLLANDNVWAFVDCGPRGIPGAIGVHGHNDATSFELALEGQSVIVDSGMYTYSRYPAINNEMKSSKAHNLIIIDDRQISDTPEDLWVIGEDVRAEALELNEQGDQAQLKVTHHGFERLEDPVTISRLFNMSTRGFEITDCATAARKHSLEIRFHTPLSASIEGDSIVLSGDSISISVKNTDKEMEVFCEPCKLAQSYGVYRPQGYVFGWRKRLASLPWAATTSFSVMGEK